MEEDVGAGDVADEGVVVNPHDEDGEETGDEADVVGPLVEKGFEELGVGGGFAEFGGFEVEDEKSDGDGEDAVGEGFEAGSFFFFGSGGVGNLHALVEISSGGVEEERGLRRRVAVTRNRNARANVTARFSF